MAVEAVRKFSSTLVRRIVRRLMITVVLAFAVAACLPVLIHRSAFDAAFLRWTRNPTPENSSLLNEEAHRNPALGAAKRVRNRFSGLYRF